MRGTWTQPFMTDSLQAVQAVQAAESFGGGNPSPEAVLWIIRGIRKAVADGVCLETALGLTAVKPHGWQAAIRHREMVRHIRAAGACFPDSSNWSRAILLSMALDSITAESKPRNEFETHLIAALKSNGGKVPHSVEQLYSILVSAPDSSKVSMLEMLGAMVENSGQVNQPDPDSEN